MRAIFGLIFVIFYFTSFCQDFEYDKLNRLIYTLNSDSSRTYYTYDKLGNRTGLRTVSNNCRTRFFKFDADFVEGATYRWQVDTGNGFENIDSSDIYFGSSQNSLYVLSPPTNFAFRKYRCLIYAESGILYSDIYTLRYTANWIGSVDSNWFNAANWECGLVPDSNVDVIITTGRIFYPDLIASTSINSLICQNGSSLLIRPNVNLFVISRQE